MGEERCIRDVLHHRNLAPAGRNIKHNVWVKRIRVQIGVFLYIYYILGGLFFSSYSAAQHSTLWIFGLLDWTWSVFFLVFCLTFFIIIQL